MLIYLPSTIVIGVIYQISKRTGAPHGVPRASGAALLRRRDGIWWDEAGCIMGFIADSWLEPTYDWRGNLQDITRLSAEKKWTN